MDDEVRNEPAGTARNPSPSFGGWLVDEILRRRYIVYILFIGAIMWWRLAPQMTSVIKKVPGIGKASGGSIVIAGTDGAPAFLVETVAQFMAEYPKVSITLSGGGTVQALENILNKRAQIAALSRAPSEREMRIAGEHGDSLVYFPVALGGIAILAPRASGIEQITLAELRSLLTSGPAAAFPGRRIERFYGPNPNGGLWESLVERLGMPQEMVPSYVPLETGSQVLEALRQDPNGIGFASTLTYELPAQEALLREVAVVNEGTGPRLPTKANLVDGSYPLFHHLYFCTVSGGEAVAAGFVTYYTQPTGQRWVARRGFLPARLPSREIRLTGGSTS
jgi:phosphate transport system substrate-binding protein